MITTLFCLLCEINNIVPNKQEESLVTFRKLNDLVNFISNHCKNCLIFMTFRVNISTSIKSESNSVNEGQTLLTSHVTSDLVM